MATAKDVAKFFLSKIDDSNGDIVTHLKLQKLVYYAQAWSLVLRDKKIFEDCIQAWKNGPVSPQVWSEYKPYSEKAPIPKATDFDETIFDVDELDLLNLINSKYGDFTASKLWRLSHTEHPWLEARRGIPEDQNSNEVILDEWMKDYYSNFVDIKSKSIHTEAFSENKELGSLITLEYNGKGIQIKTDDLPQYFKSQGALKQVKLDIPPRRKLAV